MAGDKDVKLTIRVDDAGTLSVLDSTGRKLREVGDTAERAGHQGTSAFSKLQAGIITLNQAVDLAQRAFYALAGPMTAALGAANDQDKALAQLRNSLQNAGQNTDEYAAHLERMAGAFQASTRYADEMVLGVESTLIAFGAQADQVQRATAAVLDLSEKMGRDLQGATLLVGKALQGETSTLARFGIVIDEGTPKAEKFAAALAGIERIAGGSAAAAVTTYAGRVDQLKNAFGEVLEELGMVVTHSDTASDSIGVMVGWMTDLKDRIHEWAEANREVIDAKIQQGFEWFGSFVEKLPARLELAASAASRLAGAVEMVAGVFGPDMEAEAALDKYSVEHGIPLPGARPARAASAASAAAAEVPALWRDVMAPPSFGRNRSARPDTPGTTGRGGADTERDRLREVVSSLQEAASLDEHRVSLAAQQADLAGVAVERAQAELAAAVDAGAQYAHRLALAERLDEAQRSALTAEREALAEAQDAAVAAKARAQAELDGLATTAETLDLRRALTAEIRQQTEAEGKIGVALAENAAKIAQTGEVVRETMRQATTTLDLGEMMRDPTAAFEGALNSMLDKKYGFDMEITDNFTVHIPGAMAAGMAEVESVFGAAMSAITGEAAAGAHAVGGYLGGMAVDAGGALDSIGRSVRSVFGAGAQLGVGPLSGIGPADISAAARGGITIEGESGESLFSGSGFWRMLGDAMGGGGAGGADVGGGFSFDSAGLIGASFGASGQTGTERIKSGETYRGRAVQQLLLDLGVPSFAMQGWRGGSKLSENLSSGYGIGRPWWEFLPGGEGVGRDPEKTYVSKQFQKQATATNVAEMYGRWDDDYSLVGRMYAESMPVGEDKKGPYRTEMMRTAMNNMALLGFTAEQAEPYIKQLGRAVVEDFGKGLEYANRQSIETKSGMSVLKQDIVTLVDLFHDLPPNVDTAALAMRNMEMVGGAWAVNVEGLNADLDVLLTRLASIASASDSAFGGAFGAAMEQGGSFASAVRGASGIGDLVRISGDMYSDVSDAMSTSLYETIYNGATQGLLDGFNAAVKETESWQLLQGEISNAVQSALMGGAIDPSKLMDAAGKVAADLMPAAASVLEAGRVIADAFRVTPAAFRELSSSVGEDISDLQREQVMPAFRMGWIRDRVSESRAALAGATTDAERMDIMEDLRGYGMDLASEAGRKYAPGSIEYDTAMQEAIDVLSLVGDAADQRASEIAAQITATDENTAALKENTAAKSASGAGVVINQTITIEGGMTGTTPGTVGAEFEGLLVTAINSSPSVRAALLQVQGTA